MASDDDLEWDDADNDAFGGNDDFGGGYGDDDFGGGYGDDDDEFGVGGEAVASPPRRSGDAPELVSKKKPAAAAPTDGARRVRGSGGGAPKPAPSPSTSHERDMFDDLYFS